MKDGFLQEELNPDHLINFSYSFELDSNWDLRAKMPVSKLAFCILWEGGRAGLIIDVL